MEKKETCEKRGCADDFTFATPSGFVAGPAAGLRVSTAAGQHSRQKGLRRSPRKRQVRTEALMDDKQPHMVRHIHVSTTEDLVRQASQEAAELEFIATRCKKLKERSKPKQPSGAFVFFLNEYRSQMVKDASLQKKKTNLGKMTKEAGILWREMDHEKKRPYQEMAAKDKERYLAEKREYSTLTMGLNVKLPVHSSPPSLETMETPSSALRSYQQYLQGQIDDLQNRLNMFRSRCAPHTQSLSVSTSPLQSIPAQCLATLPSQQQQEHTQHVVYVDPNVRQMQYPTSYHQPVSIPVPRHPVGQHQHQKEEQQQEEERTGLEIFKGRIIS